MMREINRRSSGPLITYRVGMGIILVLVTVLIAGSLYALIRPSGSRPLFRIGRQGGAVDGRKANAAPESVFSGIGRLRIPVAGRQETTIILSISFPYPAADRPFSEELASHIGDFRSIATAYFSSLPAEKIVRFDEKAAKSEILKRYNAVLRLGKIETLYFNDFLVVE